MRSFRFSKPKSPGFGISKNFYLSILSPAPALPSILQWVNPEGAGGAVMGLGAPLAAGASKDALGKPMERGAYAVATQDKKTVLRLLVMSKEEAGFDPELIARSSVAEALDREVLVRIRATWLLCQASFESHHPMVYPSMRFLLDFAQRGAELTGGVVADPLSRRYLLPTQLLHSGTTDEGIDVRDAVAIGFLNREDGVYAYTLGLQKFALPEFEIAGIDAGTEGLATDFLLGVCQSVLAGNLVGAGMRVGSASVAFEIQQGGLDRGMWEGIDVFELLPPTRHTATEALLASKAENG